MILWKSPPPLVRDSNRVLIKRISRERIRAIAGEVQKPPKFEKLLEGLNYTQNINIEAVTESKPDDSNLAF